MRQNLVIRNIIQPEILFMPMTYCFLNLLERHSLTCIVFALQGSDIVSWFMKLPPRVLTPGERPIQPSMPSGGRDERGNGPIICPGKKRKCMGAATCCKLKSGEWGCCPVYNVSEKDYQRKCMCPSHSYCSFQIHGSIYSWLIVPGGCPNSTNIFSLKIRSFPEQQEYFLWRIIPSKTC